MASTRLTLVRGSIILNAFLVFYLCMNWFSGHTDMRNTPHSSPHYRSLEGLFVGSAGAMIETVPLDNRLIEANGVLDGSNSPSNDYMKEKELSSYNDVMTKREDIGNPDMNDMLQDGKGNSQDYKSKEIVGVDEGTIPKAEIILDSENSAKAAKVAAAAEHPMQEPPREVQESVGVTEHLVEAAIPTEAPDPPLNSLEKKMYSDLRDCPTKSLVPFNSQHGDYWILENYIPAALAFRCDESVTYTTHGDFTFLDNLETLTSRWQGPVSIGVYAPGTDFEATIDTILYLRNCWAEGVKKFVTFHLLYHTNHVPSKIPSTDELLQRKTECRADPPKWTNITTYRQQKKLVYPVNVARNIARRAAQTYFVFPSDVELYPSVNFIPEFLKMLKKPDFSPTSLPKVFVFSIFEVKESATVPETKSELLAMLKKGDAIPFHKKVCAKCHNVPHSTEWLSAPILPGLSVVHVGKRLDGFKKWEPIYVGTQREPLYDERLSWEGKSDKMTQMYILCVRDYEFLILDNAFLVHRPGIKDVQNDPSRDKVVVTQNTLIRKHILPEYKILFGTKKECVV